jgi:hypothetical protein
MGGASPASAYRGSSLDPGTIQENDRFVNDARVGGSPKPEAALFECHYPECIFWIVTEERPARCPDHGIKYMEKAIPGKSS